GGWGVGGGALGRVGALVLLLRYRGECSGGDAVDRAHQRLGPGRRQTVQGVTGGVVGSDRFGKGAEDRSGVHLLDDPERGRSGDVVPVQQCVLDRGGSTPGGQQRKVQVDPPVLWDVEDGPRQQGDGVKHRVAVR